MDFKQIEAFVNVARYKSFSKAADAMFFTQPTISAHVAALENELGQKLFNFFENYRPPPLTKGNSFSNIGLP